MSITISDFNKQFKATSKKMQYFIDNTAPRLAGKVVISISKQSFQNESFQGSHWREVQRRTPSTASYRYNQKRHPARLTRPILTGDTGDLARSIKASYGTASVTIFSDKVYAKVHNEGLRSGRGSGFIMPKRQFIGNSPSLQQQVNQAISDKLNQLFK